MESYGAQCVYVTRLRVATMDGVRQLRRAYRTSSRDHSISSSTPRKPLLSVANSVCLVEEVFTRVDAP